MYLKIVQSNQIDIQLIMSLLAIKILQSVSAISENFKLDSTTEDFLFKLLKNVEVTIAGATDQI